MIIFSAIVAFIACSNDKGSIPDINDEEIVKIDPDIWRKVTLLIYYDQDNSETSRIEYSYDKQGREASQKISNKGVINAQSRSYAYNGKKIMVKR